MICGGHKLKIFLITTLLLIATSAGASVDVLFNPAAPSVERNNFLTMGVVASANSSAQITAIDANYTFDKDIFLNPNLQSSITGWPQSIESVNTLTGYVTYQKSNVGQAEYHFDVNAGQAKNMYNVTYKVSANAPLGVTTFDFDTQGFLNIVEGVSNITGGHNQASITILPDTTPPETSASHATGIYSSAINVTLFATDSYDDLFRIQYTTNGVTPNASSPIYSSAIAIPENAVTKLMFFGTDNDGNEESVNVRTYTVDSAPPEINGLVVDPNFAKAGKVITINFTLSEAMTGVNSVSVKIGSYSAVGIDVTYPDYEYIYTITGSEPEGVNTLEIRATDGAGNVGIDNSEEIAFDFTAPTYSDPAISAAGPDELYIQFLASEALDTANTVVSIGGNNWSYVENTDLNYVYSYTLSASENTRLVEVHGYDLAGNDSYSTEGWEELLVTGEDLYGNAGEKMVTVDIDYSP
jgi:hypothetical protein